MNVSNSGTPTALRMFEVSHGVVYLDPMFPNRRRAAPSLTMQVLHSLEQTADQPERLLEAALDSDAARVVVKRPIKADILGGRVPSSQIKAKTIRFDLYETSTIDDCERFQGVVDAKWLRSSALNRAR